MRKIKLEPIAEAAKNRPSGYQDDIFAAAKSITENHVLITDINYKILKQKYQQTAQRDNPLNCRTTMLISYSGAGAGYALGDIITMIAATKLLIENDKHDRYLLTLQYDNKFNFLWDKLIRENNIEVIYDKQQNSTDKFLQFNERFASKQINNINFDTYRELYPRISGASRQKILTGKETSTDNINILEYYILGQAEPTCGFYTTEFPQTLIDVPVINRSKSVLIAPHENCQKNKHFTLFFWRRVIQILLEQGISVIANDATNFMNDYIDHPQFTKTFYDIEQLIEQVASVAMVACGNTGIGWLAAATETPFVAMERKMVLPEYSFQHSGCGSLLEVVNIPRPEIAARIILKHLRKN